MSLEDGQNSIQDGPLWIVQSWRRAQLFLHSFAGERQVGGGILQESLRDRWDSLIIEPFQWSSSQNSLRKGQDPESYLLTSDEDRGIQEDEGRADPPWPETPFPRDVVSDKAQLHNKELDEKQKEVKKWWFFLDINNKYNSIIYHKWMKLTSDRS